MNMTLCSSWDSVFELVYVIPDLIPPNMCNTVVSTGPLYGILTTLPSDDL